MTIKQNKSSILARLPIELIEKLKTEASLQHRTQSGQLEHIINSYFERQTLNEHHSKKTAIGRP